MESWKWLNTGTPLGFLSTRWDVLSGPSKTTRVCDGDCIVGGCGEDVPDNEGVLCGGCQLFLCHKCFGTTVVLAKRGPCHSA